MIQKWGWLRNLLSTIHEINGGWIYERIATHFLFSIFSLPLEVLRFFPLLNPGGFFTKNENFRRRKWRGYKNAPKSIPIPRRRQQHVKMIMQFIFEVIV